MRKIISYAILIGLVASVLYSPFVTAQNQNVKVNDDGGTIYHEDPTIAVDNNGMIYVAWEDFRESGQVPNKSHIYFAKSMDGGKSFLPNVKVSEGRTDECSYPSIAAGPTGKIYVVWFEENYTSEMGNIYFAYSIDGGKSFSPNVRVNEKLYNASYTKTAVAVDSNDTVYVAWNTHGNLLIAKSLDGGNTFLPPTKINDTNGTASFTLTMVVGRQGYIYAAWGDDRNGNLDI